MAVDGRVAVDLHAVVGSEKGLRDGSIILVSDEMASSGAFVLHDLMKRHLKSGGRGTGTISRSQNEVSQPSVNASSGRADPSSGISFPHNAPKDPEDTVSRPQRHVEDDGCATAVCLVALSRTPSEHCLISKRQGCNLTDLQHHGRVALVDGLSLMSSHFIQPHGAGHCDASTPHRPNSEPQGISAQKGESQAAQRPSEQLGSERPDVAVQGGAQQQSEPSNPSLQRPDGAGQAKMDEAVAASMKGFTLGDDSESRVRKSDQSAISQATRDSDGAVPSAGDASQCVEQDGGGTVLHSLMLKVQSVVDQLGSKSKRHTGGGDHASDAVARGRRVCLVIDDVSVLEVLAGGDGRHVVHFLSWCRSLQSHGHPVSLLLLAHRDVAESAPPSYLPRVATWLPPLYPYLMHHADVALHVRALSSGFSPDVHGQVWIEHRSMRAKLAFKNSSSSAMVVPHAGRTKSSGRLEQDHQMLLQSAVGPVFFKVEESGSSYWQVP